MVSYLFIIAAAFFNACMDAFENENYFESIFKNWDQRFWYKRQSWKYANKIFNYRLDAWHLSKSLMIISFCCFAIFPPEGSWWVILINCFVFWNFFFWLCYHKIFGVK